MHNLYLIGVNTDYLKTGEAALINTVRALDKSGPGENGDNLVRIWRFLVPSIGERLHAAEKVILRWLLKEMNGTFASSKHAENLRRYPLAWSILGLIFQRIPLFSLAKTLADRRFVAVLAQTLKDISRPSKSTGGAASLKRKRKKTSIPYELDVLKAEEGCLKSAEAVFKALRILLSRLDDEERQTANDRMGAEHLKSLFCAPVSEAKEIFSPLLLLCKLALETSFIESRSADWMDWMKVATLIWEFHLKAPEDVIEVASHLFSTSAIILGRVEGIPERQNMQIDASISNTWGQDLSSFLHHNLILPAKAAFLNRGDLEAVTRALDVTRSYADISAPVLYWLVCETPDIIAGPTSKDDNKRWMQEVFKLVEASLHHLLFQSKHERASQVVTGLLYETIERGGGWIATEDLRSVCQTYALREENTNWELLNWVAACDTDAFLVSEDGSKLLEESCARINNTKVKDVDQQERISGFVTSLIDGFIGARDLSGFFKLWYQQVSACLEMCLQSSEYQPIWLSQNLFEHYPQKGAIEKSMTIKQLISLLNWVPSQDQTNEFPEAYYILADTIVRDITTKDFQDAIGATICQTVANKISENKSSSRISGLAWRLIAKVISWTTEEERDAIWQCVRVKITTVLETSNVWNNDTYEAAICCYEMYLSMQLHCKWGAESRSTFLNALQRVGAELRELGLTLSELGWEPVSGPYDDLAQRQKKKGNTHQAVHYIDWVLYKSPELIV
jgi:nucleolar pre-ribosomal-associated protein 2